ncbi:MAG: formylmethanofuran dehydrogenase subunit A [Planctomycetales bacterium]|nr:formylmethanofuran dehydrogenase subunit A [Planctomycetales bacterium]
MLQIKGATIHDPANAVDGAVGDLWIDRGRIVAPPPGGKPTRIIDAHDLIAMPGGVDMHCHIAGPKVTAARKLRSDDKHEREQKLQRKHAFRSGTLGSVPSTFATGYKYAGLGYTTAFDAAVPPLGARQAHEELADTPCIDKGFYVLLGNNHFVMDCLKSKDPARLRSFLAWLLARTSAFAPKLVNPGGVEVWKQSGGGALMGLEDRVPHFEVSPREIIQGVAQAAGELALPHPLHLHCNQLGMPGNWRTTLATMQALEGHRGHLTHIQFHSYGGGDEDEGSLASRVEPLVEYVNANDNLTVDVGQVLFGDTTNMTGDGPLGHYLYKATGDRWCSHDTEVEAGCGVLPMTYRNKNLFNALQWAIGLEWHLMIEDPWRLALSTDSPNGGSFLAYPELIRLLMDRDYRDEQLAKCPAKLHDRCGLAGLDREYSLQEIAIITRASPARILGLANKGHLGVGADADVTLYARQADWAATFQLPRYVVKSGVVVIDDYELAEAPDGRTLRVAPAHDPAPLGGLEKQFAQRYSIQLDHFGVHEEELGEVETVK